MREMAVTERSLLLRSSPWFVPHVASYVVAYAFATIAFCLTVAGLHLRANRRDASRHDRLSAVMLRGALPFMVLGLACGAFWADAAWGAYWSWDGKETGALATTLLYLLWFHLWRDRRFRRFSDPVHVAAFLCLLFTFLAVGLVPLSIRHGSWQPSRHLPDTLLPRQ